jgi:hypothetical protein
LALNPDFVNLDFSPIFSFRWVVYAGRGQSFGYGIIPKARK